MRPESPGNATSTLAQMVPVEVVEEPEFVTAEVVQPADTAQRPGWLRRLFAWIDSSWEWVFGGLSLIVGLAFLATFPIVQLLSLGYLLEASGRVARSGRLREGFVGMRKAARVGSVVLGTWILLWLPRFASSLWNSSRLIDPESRATLGLRVLLFALTAWVMLHAAAACQRGGRLRHFLWPRPIRFVREMFRPGAYERTRDAVWDFFVGLRLPHYFWLGLRGFVGGMIWLALPVTLLGLGRRWPVVGVLGGLLLAIVLLYLPFLQTRMAAENRFRAMFELRGVRGAYRRAPIAFLIALMFTLALAVPLYLLKIELIPREAAWLPSLLFIVSIFPARLLCGWALGRAGRCEAPRHWLFRTLARLPMLPIAGLYVVIVYFTQYLSWHGVWSLYEQHAFLLPVPFLGG